MNNIIRISILFTLSLLATLAYADPNVPSNVQDPSASKVNSVAQTAHEAGKININVASAVELKALKGIGKKRAEQIVKDREVNGPFTSAQDLTRIKGIGPKTVAKNLDKITIGVVTTPPESKPNKE